ncbi:unnamed protein product [Cyclocybe aegerita]|uniref:Six-hairpin glycosidase n=1 Tax=Cyclocybe aegerita TaxID=1973307 RepID=A0A8S0VZB2_CYCAE|nr:unnamed protein product [Cyclocybe aegerita]
MVNLDNAILPAIGLISATIAEFNAFPFSPGFDIKKVAAQAVALPTHSWEYGTTTQALLELYNPELSVFGQSPFPVPSVDVNDIRALGYVAKSVRFGNGYAALDRGNGAAGDPASMGVGALMVGKTNATFAKAADDTIKGLLEDVPRYWNGAISHRANTAELWADFMYMVPPYLAYYAADKEDEGLLRESVRQCQLYRDILQSDTNEAYKGAWRHIIGPESQDTGLWSTGNAWAAAGMTRVLATVNKSSFVTNSTWRAQATNNLTRYIKEIVDGARGSNQQDGLLRNYWNDRNTQGHGFGEISGSSLLAAVVYRMAVLQPEVFTASYVQWADDLRTTLAGNDANGNPHITSTGIATPAVNPLGWLDTRPFTKGSPEGNAFVVLMYAGWRDCVKAGKCSATSTGAGSAEALVAAAAAVDSLAETNAKREISPSYIHRAARRHLGTTHHSTN